MKKFITLIIAFIISASCVAQTQTINGNKNNTGIHTFQQPIVQKSLPESTTNTNAITVDAQGNTATTPVSRFSPLAIKNGTTLFTNSTGNEAGNGSGATIYNSNLFGQGAGTAATGVNNVNFFGSSAGSFATSAYQANFFGPSAGYNATNAYNSNFFGPNVAFSAINANNSNFFGRSAGYSATNANSSNFFGQFAGYGAANASVSNLFGFQVGYNPGGAGIGENNIIIGTNISLPATTANSINIGGVLFGTGSYSTLTGNPSTTPNSGGKIGIGIVAPTEKLDVAGKIKTLDGITSPIDHSSTITDLDYTQKIYVDAADATLVDQITNIQSQINPNTYVVTDAGSSLVINDFTLNAGWSWKINNVTNTNASPVVITIPLATSGYQRIDLIVLNASNAAVRVAGTESAGTAASPTTPINTIAIASIFSDSTVHTSATPKPKYPVTQFLRNGVTDYSPSEDVVYDALALKVDKNTAIAGSTNTKITYDSKGLVTSGTSLVAGDIPNIAESQVTGLVSDLSTKKSVATGNNYKWETTSATGNLQETTVTPSRAVATDVNGLPIASTTTATELSFVNGATSNLQAQINTKLSSNIGTINYLPKVTGANSLGNSRIVDTGTYLGIGTANAPTKDITLGNQTSREIGVEQSSNTIAGRGLQIRGGRTINFITSSDFILVNQDVARDYLSFTASSNGSVYAISGGFLYRKVGGDSNFTAVSTPGIGSINGMCISSSDDMYVSTSTGIYKQINLTGSWTLLSSDSSLRAIDIAPNGDLYGVIGLYFFYAGDAYKLPNGSNTLVPLGLNPTYSYAGVAIANDGSVYISGYAAGILKQPNGSSTFTQINTSEATSICIDNANNLYSIGWNGGVVKKQTNLTGPFLTVSSVLGEGVAIGSDFNNNIYANAGGGLYLQTNYTIGYPDLAGGDLNLYTGTGKGTGDNNFNVYTGQKLASGTDMQVETLRARINNEGLMTLPSVTNALISADATGKAVVTKEYLSSNQSLLPLTLDAPNSKVSINGKLLVGADNSFSVEQVTSTNPRITKIIADKKSGTVGAGWLSNLEFYTKDGDTERLSMSIEGGTVPKVKVQGDFQVYGNFVQNYLNLTPTDLRILDAGNYASRNTFKINRLFSSPYESIDFDFNSTNGLGWYPKYRFLVKSPLDTASYSALDIESTAVDGKALATLNGDIMVMGNFNLNGSFSPKKITLLPNDLEIINGGSFNAIDFSIKRTVVSNYRGVDFNVNQTPSGGGWYGRYRFFIKGESDTASYSALEIENTAVDGKALVSINGTSKASNFKLSALNTAPSSATDTGVTGEIRITATYVYVCIATNTWVRTALTTW
jgi:hypothetical protein